MPPAFSAVHDALGCSIATVIRQAVSIVRRFPWPVFVSITLLAICGLTAGCAEHGRRGAAHGAGAASPAGGSPASGAEGVPSGASSSTAPSPDATVRALTVLEEARRAYESKDYERSKELLQALLQEPEGLTGDQVTEARTRLGRATSILHQRELEAQEKAAPGAAGASARTATQSEAAPAPDVPDVARRKAGDLLAQMGTLVNEEKYGDAAVGIDALDGMREQLSLQERWEYDLLRDSVQRKTQQLRPLTAKEKEARAEEDFTAGINEYEAKEYGAASRALTAAASFEISLGFWNSRRLRGARREVDQTIAELRADCARGKELLEKEDYAQAAKVLRKVKESGITIGPAENAALDDLLAEATRPREDRTEVKPAQPKKDAAGVLAAAESVAGEGKGTESQAKPTPPSGLEKQPSPEQAAQAAALKAAEDARARAEEARRLEGKAKESEAQAARLVAGRKSVLAKMQAADEAFQRGDPDAARGLLLETQEMLNQPELGSLPALSGVPAALAQKLAAADDAIKRKAHAADVAQQVGALLAEAQKLSATDLLAAEKKTLAATDMAREEGLALTQEQAQVHRAVLAAVEAKYGAERRLRPKLYGRLLNLGDIYRGHGEYGKATQMLTMVKDAPAGVVTDKYRDVAISRLGEAIKELSQQEDAARGIMSALNDCRGELKRHALQEALTAAEAALTAAGEKKLAGEPLADVLTQAEAVLNGDFEAALRETYPPLQEVVDERLARARIVAARGLSEFYLSKKAPDLAEPCLRQVEAAASVDAESAAWAKGQLADIPALKAEVERARLTEGEADARRLLDLASKLNEAARAGQLADVSAAEQALADARVQIAIRKARSDIARGAYGEAVHELDQASPDRASRDLVEKSYKPLAQEIQKLGAVMARLQAAEDALAAHDLAAAGARLAESEAFGVEGPPLVLKQEALAAVLESALDVQETATAFRGQKDHLLERARAALAEVQAREQVWQSYYGAVRAFLEGREGAQSALEGVAAKPQGLLPIEVAAISDVAQGLAAVEKKTFFADAERKLAEAWDAYTAGDYVTAADLVDALRGMPGAESNTALRDAAGKLAELVQVREAQAQALYDQAVSAYKAGNADQVRALTDELKARYSRTRVYRDHM